MESYLDCKLNSETGLYRTDFTDGHVVWKALSWGVYKKYREAQSLLGAKIAIEVEESIFNTCVIYSSFDVPPPPDLEDPYEIGFWLEHSRAEQPAGIISTICRLALFISGAMEAHQIIAQLDQHRPFVENIEDQMTVAICQAFPSYTPEDIEKMDWQTVLKRSAQAEVILGTRFEIFDAEAEERKLEATRKFNLEKEIRQSTEYFQGKGQQIPQEEINQLRDEKRQLREAYLASRGRR